MTTTAASLPGIVFETDAPNPSHVLPRMDIAGFVGYAARGPLHTPVAIESVGRLRDVFGPDLELAWDDAQRTMLTSNLGRAVEQFFASEGRRCWVIRAAMLGEDGAEANEFPVPGLIDADGMPVRAQARATGTWSDDLRVGAVVDRRVIGQADYLPADDLILLTRPEVDVRSGDLLELALSDGMIRFATVKSVSLESAGTPRVRVDLSVHDWFHPDRDLGSGTCTAFFVRRNSDLQIPLPNGVLESGGFTYVVDANEQRPEVGDELHLTLLDSGDGVVIDVEALLIADDELSGQVAVTIEGDSRWHASARIMYADGAVPMLVTCAVRENGGYWVEFDLGADDRHPGFADILQVTLTGSDDVVWMTIADVEFAQVDDTTITVRAFATESLWPAAAPAIADPTRVRVTRICFDLLIWTDLQLVQRLGDLGCSAGDALELPMQRREETLATTRVFTIGDDVPPRFWGRLPIDEIAFQINDGQAVVPVEGTAEHDAHEPRFSLAGPLEQASVYLPLGMALMPIATATAGAVEGSLRDSLEREGIDEHTWSTFVDDRFASTKTGSLASGIRSLIYEADDAQPLRGLHALWPLSEVTIAAVPDAGQPGWQDAALDGRISPLTAPAALEAEFGHAWLTVRWASIDGAGVIYELAESADPAFEVASTVATGTALHTHLPLGACDVRYFRVRARVEDVVGPWSATLVVAPPTDFDACEPRTVDVPDISLGEQPLALSWTAVDDATGYSIESSPDPTFAAIAVQTGVIKPADLDQQIDSLGQTTLIASLTDATPHSALGELAADLHGAEIRYFRVRAWRGHTPSPWSDTVAWSDVSESRWRTIARPAGELHEPSLSAHRALLRLCAARGDVMSVLTVPHDHDDSEVKWHAAALRSRQDDEAGASMVPALSADEHVALTHGALYHPWVATRPAGKVTSTPRPVDGLMAGLMAKLALTEGAWRAPANVPLPGALSLTPTIPRVTLLDQLESHVNVVRDEPSGFITLSSITLSDVQELSQIGSRRLMSLLRRLAQREGDQLAFESNSAATRERVFFTFTTLLEQMFTRGAFAGSSPAQAFQVVVDETINTQQTIDRGQLFVELKVAPAMPLRFLTVRLVQVDGQIIAVEEA